MTTETATPTETTAPAKVLLPMRRCCQECGGPMTIDAKQKAKAATKKFCTPACRMAFNNRRRDRGAELYDFVMNMRFEREEAKDRGVWTLICTLASSYNDADKLTRGGRKSYQTIEQALQQIPIARLDGDGR